MAMEQITDDIHTIARDYASLMWSSMLNALEQHPLTITAYKTVKNSFMEHLNLSHDHARKFMFAYLFGNAFITFSENESGKEDTYEFDPEAIGPYVVAKDSKEEMNRIQQCFYTITGFDQSTEFPNEELEVLAKHLYAMFMEHFSHYTDKFRILDIAFTG